MFDTTLRPFLDASTGTMPVRAFRATLARADIIKAPLLRVAGHEVRPEEKDVSCLLDLSPLRQILEQDIRGVLGPSFFCGRLVQFDFDKGIVRLSQRDVNKDALGTPWPLRSDNFGQLWVDNLRIGDRTESFQLSTGSYFGIQVHDWLFSSLRAEGKLREIHPNPMLTPASLQNRSGGLLSKVSWGGFTRRDVWITNGDGNALGLKYLSRFVITIDSTGGQIYLRPGKKLSRPDSRDVAGFDTEKREGVIVVTAVRERSPASEAGVFVGDSVTSINGATCRGIRLLEFAWRVEESKGARLTLTLDRNGASITVSFDVPLSMGPELFSSETAHAQEPERKRKTP